MHERNFGPVWPNALGGILRVSCSFTVGVVLARYSSRLGHVRSWKALVPISVLIATLFVDRHLYFALSFIAAGYPGLLVLGATWELPKMFDRFCGWLGDISYPLYMIHYPVLFLWHSAAIRMGLPSTVEVGGFIAIILVGSTLLTGPDAKIRRTLSGFLHVRFEAKPRSQS